MRQDLGVISEWAGGYDQKSLEEYRTLENGKYYKEWRKPHRVIYRFNYDSIRSIRQSPPTPDFDTRLLSDLATLDHAITNFFSVLDRYERMTQADPATLRKLYLKMREEDAGWQVEYTHAEKELQEMAYRLNFQIHIDAIGAEEQKDKEAPGLHWAHKQAKESLDRVESSLEKPRYLNYDHRFYIVGDLLALVFFISAVALLHGIVTQLPLSHLLWRLVFWLL